MQYPYLVTAGITYSWGWWNMPSEIDTAIDVENSAPESYMVLGLRDLSYHLTTVREPTRVLQRRGIMSYTAGSRTSGPGLIAEQR
jgi:hypothetical protein